MKVWQKYVLVVIAMLILVMVVCNTRAGTIDISWSEVDHPGLSGYRVYYGIENVDEGETWIAKTDLELSAQVPVQNCLEYHIAVKSVTGVDTLSEGWSPIVRGWGRPEITDQTADTVGIHTIIGNNFRSGAQVKVGATKIPDADVVVVDCHTIKIPATPGAEIIVRQGAEENADGMAPFGRYSVPLEAPVETDRTDVIGAL